ncbi:MAG: phosphate ABC transporter permease PstA [Gammaproteobacteria bacterium]
MTRDQQAAAQKRLQKRYRAERRFKAYCIGALCIAGAFLALFFTDIVIKALPGLKQAEIELTYTYTDDVMFDPGGGVEDEALSDEFNSLVSRGWSRLLPGLIEENPELIDTTRTEWVLASDDVDQYLKGNYNTLDEEARRVVDRLAAQGRVALNFNTHLFTNGDSKIPEMAGLKSALVGSLYLIFLVFILAFPLGVMTAVYLEEFAPENHLTNWIEVNINNLAAVPSIIFGLLGLAVFINFFGTPRSSALAGGLTIGIMTLPLIIIAARAALRAVPDAIRQGALAVGASRWQMVKDHVLPLALPGILTGTIIGMAVAIGETAPLLIIGMIAYIPDPPTSFTQAATVLPAQIYTWAGQPEQSYTGRTAAGILVLLAVMILMNATAIYLRNHYTRRW